jgi:hypothetical protein
MALGSTQPVTEMSTSIIYYFLGVKTASVWGLPPKCADCLKIWEPQTVEPSRACPDIVTKIPLPFPLQLCGMHKHKQIL